jgi:hypothetical protein
MPFTLNFSRFVEYDAGLPGISLEVTLSLINSSVTIPAKVDTGSTDCIFARKYGEQLGLVIEDGERIRIGTATGGFDAYRHFVTFRVLDYEFDAGVCFIQDENINRNVLGRHGFLDRVKLGLVDYEGKLFLSPYNEVI